VDRAVSDIITVVLGGSIISAATLVGYWLSLRARREARREGIVDSEQFQAAIDSVRADLGAPIAELQERLDFAERLLAQERDRPALARPIDQPQNRE
jgi:uncharacterized protein (DUF3084 family)